MALFATLFTVSHAAPLGFEELLARTQQSPVVRLAEQELTLAQRDREQSRSPVSLSLSSGVRGEAGRSPSPLSLDPVSLSATFNLPLFGPAASALARADAAVWAAETALVDAREETLLKAVEQFLGALRSAQQEAVLRAQLEVGHLELREVRARLGAGAAGETEVFEAQLVLAQSESELAAALQASAELLGALTLTLGTEVVGVAGPVPTADPRLLNRSPTNAHIERRSDVQRALMALREAVLAEADTRFGTLPSGSLSVGYAHTVGAQALEVGAFIGSESGFQPALSASYAPFLEAETESTPGGTEAGALSASLSVSVTLDLALSGVLETAALRVAQAEADLGGVRRLAELEIVSRERELEAATSALRLSEQQLELSEQLLSGTQTRFALGLVAPVELGRAEGARLAAQLARSQAADAVFLAHLHLARALAVTLTNLF